MTSVARTPGLDARREARARRRDALLDAADRAIRKEGPDTSMATIAAEAGITKPILYREFGDKGGLYRALIERHAETLLATLRTALTTRGGTRARARATVAAYLQILADHEDAYRFIMAGQAAAEPGVLGLVASFERQFGDDLALGLRATIGIADDDPRAEVWAHAIAGMVRGAGAWWLENRDTVDRDQVVEETAALLCDGMLGAVRITPLA